MDFLLGSIQCLASILLSQTLITRLYNVIWDMHSLKNFSATWSASISRTLPTISWFRNTRHKKTSYELLPLILAKSCKADSFLSKLVNNILFFSSEAIIIVITFKLATPNANAMDLTCSKLTIEEK